MKRKLWHEFYLEDDKFNRWMSLLHRHKWDVKRKVEVHYFEPLNIVTTNAPLSELRALLRLDDLRLPSDYLSLTEEEARERMGEEDLE